MSTENIPPAAQAPAEVQAPAGTQATTEAQTMAGTRPTAETQATARASTPPETCLLVYMTVDSAAEAERIAHALVRERLAAGVNVLAGARSCYWWQGEVREKTEHLLLAQTTRTAFPALERRVRALHSYKVPCIIAVPLTAGHQPFLDWTAAETAAS